MLPKRGSGSSTRTVYISFFTWWYMENPIIPVSGDQGEHAPDAGVPASGKLNYSCYIAASLWMVLDNSSIRGATSANCFSRDARLASSVRFRLRIFPAYVPCLCRRGFGAAASDRPVVQNPPWELRRLP